MFKLTDVKNSYRRYAPFYNKLFGRILHPGRLLLAQKTHELKVTNLLEVGVGTGLMLPLYPSTAVVTGVDVSTHMLDIAQALVDQEQLNHVQLISYDGTKLPFPDGSFDCVTLPYVYSVTPNPHEFIQDCWRVCADGGHLIIVNHFSNTPELSFWKILEKATQSFAGKIGFQSDFSYQTYILDLPWQRLSVEPTNLGHLSRVVVFKK